MCQILHITLLFLIFHSSASDLDFCSQEPQVESDKTEVTLGLSRWGEDAMFVFVNKPMTIPCCVKGYTNIQWFYNDLPLEVSNSTFFVDSEDPRYLRSKSVKIADGYSYTSKSIRGNYTCRASANHHAAITRTITLHVLRINYTGVPLAVTYPSNVLASPGETAYFWCSAFLGTSAMENYDQTVDWKFTPIYKYRHNFERKNYKFVSPGGGVMIGSLLKIPCVDSSMFGLQVTCLAVGDRKDTELAYAHVFEYVDETLFYKIMIASLILSVMLAVVLTLFAARYHVEIRLVCKDKFAKLENQDSCEWDVFVCYGEDSRELVYKLLVPRLEKLGYSCFAYERDALGGEHLPVTLTNRVSLCRRLLVVVSAGLMRDPLGLHVCRYALDQALGPRSLRIIIVRPPAQQTKAMMKDVNTSDSLRSLMNVSRKATLPPNDKATDRQQRRFWSELCLHLPPLRSYPAGDPAKEVQTKL